MTFFMLLKSLAGEFEKKSLKIIFCYSYQTITFTLLNKPKYDPFIIRGVLSVLQRCYLNIQNTKYKRCRAQLLGINWLDIRPHISSLEIYKLCDYFVRLYTGINYTKLNIKSQ